MKLKLMKVCMLILLTWSANASICPRCGYSMKEDDNFCAGCLRRRNNWGDKMPYGGTPLMCTLLASGPGLGIFGNPLIRVYGLDLGFLASATEEVYGISVATGNIASEVYGVKVGAITATAIMVGVQIGGINISPSDSITEMNGLQIGLLNGARYVNGVQIGFFNYAELIKGVQVGPINIIEQSPMSFFPFINFYF